MAIRNAAKAILLQDNKILVNRCKEKDTGAVYYTLPGGGQHQFETMEAAVVREVLEETGYRVEIVRFAGLAEEINLTDKSSEWYLDYAHRIVHIFLVKPLDLERLPPSELDFQQEASVWMDLREANTVPMRPKQLTGNLERIVREPCPQYLGVAFL